MSSTKIYTAVTLVLLALGSQASGQQDVLPSIPKGTIAVHLDPIATGLAAPAYAINAPGDASRLYVVEQKGQVLVLENGSLLPAPALDIQDLVSPPLVTTNANDERGLLGLAFHPGFNDPDSPGYRTLYTYNSQLIPEGTSPTYVAPNDATQNYKNVINEWKLSSTDPTVIDPASRREIISFGKNAGNHNGGTIAFGPDNYLYLGTGDGGNANDVGPSHIEPGGNAQNLSTPLGKMLRIDPLHPSLNSSSADPISGNEEYRIPTDNPFQGADQVPEIYAYGLRNPYRFSFDTLNGQLIAADVGQNTVEEINRIVRGGNYGWAVKEGDFLFDRDTGTVGEQSPGSPEGLIDPISGPLGTLEYDHDDGISITGGFVYRGSAIPELYGLYVFGDLALNRTPVRADGRLFYADLDTGLISEFLLPQFEEGFLPDGLTVHGFGQDAAGELYALATNTPSSGTGGVIYAITAVPEPSAFVLLGIGAIGLLVWSWRQRS
ncbi:MAG: PQQ-dependent sugar dehydrogenase [Pirellulaceae bacterium]